MPLPFGSNWRGKTNPTRLQLIDAVVSHIILDEDSLHGTEAAHPTLAEHDALGIATQAELDAHEAASDPHIVYQRESEKGMANGYASLGAGGTIPDAQIPATITRDSELPDLAGHVAAGDPHSGYRLESVPIAAVDVAADVATQAELDAHNHNAAYEALGAVATHAELSDPHTGYVQEAATPGGELGGTYAAPTVDASHSGSTHAAAQAAAEATAASALAGHVAAADPHTGYQRESEKSAASGYASLNSSTKVPTVELGGAGADSTKFLRGDQTWAAPTASVADPNPQGYSPGSFSVATEKYVILSRHLKLASTQRVTLAGTASLRIS